VTVDPPPDLSFVTGTTLAVGGTVTGAVSVSVNGVAATVSGTSFTATGVPLVEGGNTLTATATDGAGHVGIATINVVRDLTPPHVAIYTPAVAGGVGRDGDQRVGPWGEGQVGGEGPRAERRRLAVDGDRGDR